MLFLWSCDKAKLYCLTLNILSSFTKKNSQQAAAAASKTSRVTQQSNVGHNCINLGILRSCVYVNIVNAIIVIFDRQQQQNISSEYLVLVVISNHEKNVVRWMMVILPTVSCPPWSTYF